MSKFGEYLSNQCGNPHGSIGRIMTWAMNRANNEYDLFLGRYEKRNVEIKPLGHQYGLLVIYRK